MLDTLTESAPGRKRVGGRLSGSAVSVTVHAAIIAFAVSATMKSEVMEPAASNVDSMSFVLHPREEESAPQRLPDVPRRHVFERLVAPVHVPLGIPPIDSAAVFDSTSFKGLAPEGVFDDLEDSGPTDLSQVFIGAVVDEAPIRISSPPLEYPSAMERAGVEGVVILQATVDTTGRVESGSVRVVQSDNVAFEGAAKRLLERSIFRPGRVRGEPVRVLIQLPVQFKLIGN